MEILVSNIGYKALQKTFYNHIFLGYIATLHCTPGPSLMNDSLVWQRRSPLHCSALLLLFFLSSFVHFMNWWTSWKLEGKAMSSEDPPPSNCTTMQSRLVCQGSDSCLGGTAYLPGPAKPTQLLNQWYDFKVLQDLECPRQFGLCGAINIAEEEDHLVS